jgi:hypothetical protein
MELVLMAAVVAFIAFFVVIPAVWSKDPERRASALEVLRVILSAFRPQTRVTGGCSALA